MAPEIVLALEKDGVVERKGFAAAVSAACSGDGDGANQFLLLLPRWDQRETYQHQQHHPHPLRHNRFQSCD